MNHQYDRSWADLHGLAAKPITPPHICVLKKRNVLLRAVKSLALFLTTKYSWATSWHVAAR